MALCQNYSHVVQIGWGKSGTTTTRLFFEHLGYNSSCLRNEDVDALPITPDKTLLSRSCKHVFVGELARFYFPHESVQLQLTHLSLLRQRMPNTLFVHCWRNTSHWIRSVRHWNTLFGRLRTRDIEGLPPGHPRNDKELGRWYEDSNAYFAFVFRHRANYALIDVDNPASLRELTTRCNASYTFVPKNAGRYAHAT